MLSLAMIIKILSKMDFINREKQTLLIIKNFLKLEIFRYKKQIEHRLKREIKTLINK